MWRDDPFSHSPLRHCYGSSLSMIFLLRLCAHGAFLRERRSWSWMASKAPEITTVQPWSLGYFLQSTLNRFRHTIFLLHGDYYGRENFEPVKTYHQFIYRYTSSVKLHVIPAGDTGGFERGFNRCHGLEFLNEL